VLPLRALAMAIAGAVCTAQAGWTLLHPHRLAPANRIGWLYERFGPQGVGLGMLVLGVSMLAAGSIGSWRGWPRRRTH